MLGDFLCFMIFFAIAAGPFIAWGFLLYRIKQDEAAMLAADQEHAAWKMREWQAGLNRMLAGRDG